MAVYTETKTYHTKAHMGMIDVTDDFRAAVQNACRTQPDWRVALPGGIYVVDGKKLVLP